MRKEILDKIFSSNWNYSYGREFIDKHIIALFYEKGGFDGLYNFILSEKERMAKDKYHKFEQFYSSHLPETLKLANEELHDIDFRTYIFDNNKLFNKNNFIELENYFLLKKFRDFNDDFRGNIKSIHKISEYTIIETTRKKENNFYNISDCTNVFNSLEEALIYQIYKGKHFSTLSTLLKHIND